MAIITGKGIRFGDGEILNIHGYPLPNYLSSLVSEKPGPWSIVNTTVNFDLTNLPINSEVIVVEHTIPVEVRGGIDSKISWYRVRDNRKVFEGSYSLGYDLEPGYYYPANTLKSFGWIGYCTDMSTPYETHILDEITENGAYRIEITTTGNVNYTETAFFYVTGIPVQANIINPYENQRVYGNSLTINVEAFGGSGIDYVNLFNYDLGLTKINSAPLAYSYPYSVTYDLTNIPAGINTFYVRAFDFNGNSSDQKIVNIDYRKTRPANWVWTPQELNAFNNKGPVSTITWTRWNQFVDRVNEFREYKGSIKYPPIGGKMSANDKVLTAAKFRIVAQGIRDITTSLDESLTRVVSGNIVRGSYFTHMAAATAYIV